MKQKIYIPQPIAAAGEDYLIEKGYRDKSAAAEKNRLKKFK